MRHQPAALVRPWDKVKTRKTRWMERYWGVGLNTSEIAKRLDVSEAEVYNAMPRQRASVGVISRTVIERGSAVSFVSKRLKML